ncbi:MAG: ArsR/SmtB family transcription factor [Acidimicrobiia bacterium]
MADVIPMPDEACEVRMVDPERVESTRAELLSEDEASSLAERFKLLADPGRLRMIYALLEAGELCVCDLAATVDATESATSHQLRQLRLAGLVRSRKQGRTVYYRVDDTHVRLLLDVAVEHYLHGHDDRT